MIAAVWEVLRPAVDISPLCDDRWGGSGRPQASTERLAPSVPGLVIMDGFFDAIDGIGQYHQCHGSIPSMAWVDTIDAMGGCHRWHASIPSMPWVDAIDGIGRYHRCHGSMPSMAWVDTIDAMGGCHRWHESTPSMAWGNAIDGLVDAIDGIARCHPRKRVLGHFENPVTTEAQRSRRALCVLCVSVVAFASATWCPPEKTTTRHSVVTTECV